LICVVVGADRYFDVKYVAASAPPLHRRVPAGGPLGAAPDVMGATVVVVVGATVVVVVVVVAGATVVVVGATVGAGRRTVVVVGSELHQCRRQGLCQ
jgi:hypothetical protein